MDQNAAQSVQNAVPPTPPPQPVQRTVIPAKRGKKKLILVIAAAIVLALIGIGAYLYITGFFNKSRQNSTGAISPTPTIILNPINDGEIIIADNLNLYIYNTATMTKVPLVIKELQKPSGTIEEFNFYPSNLSFSPNGEYLFFSQYEKFYIYNFDTNATQVLDIFPNAAVDTDEVAPNSKIAVVDTGTAPGFRTKTFVDIAAGEELLETTGVDVRWASDSAHFAMGTEGIEWWNLALGPAPYNKSITLGTVNGENITEKVLLKATNSLDFTPVSWLNNKMLLYQQNEYSQPIPGQLNLSVINDGEYQKEWMEIYENPETSYWTIDITNNRKSQASSSAAPTPPQDMASYSPSGQWKVFTEGDYPYKIYISKSNGTDKIQIATGSAAAWRP